MDRIERMELESKVQVWADEKQIQEYTCALIQTEGEKVCLEISADNSTYGK